MKSPLRRSWVGLFATLLAVLLLPAARTAGAQGFQSLYTRDGVDVIAVGDNGETYRTLDGGQTWTERVIGSPTLTLRDIAGRGLAMLIASDGGLVWKSANAGGSWSSTLMSLSPNLRAAAMASDSTWVVAGANGMIFRTTDAGANWNGVGSGTVQTINAVRFVDALHGWAAGDAGTLLATADAGASWGPVAIATPNALLSVDQRGSNVWVVGAEGTAWKSGNGGASFNSVRLELDARADVRCVTMLSPDSLLLAGGGGFIRFSPDGGVTWTFQQHTLHAPITRLITYGNGAWVANSKNRVVMRTANLGATWSLPTGATLSRSWSLRQAMAGQARGNGFALNPVYKSTIYCGVVDRVMRSRDDGDTWSVAATFRLNYTKCNAFIVSPKDSNLWLAALSGGTVQDRIYRSTNGGATWDSVVTHDFGEYGIPLEMDPDHPDTVYFGGESNASGTPNSPLFRTLDFGAHWDSITTAQFRSPCDIVVPTDTTGLVLVGDGVTGSGLGKILKSTDGGQTFTAKYTLASSSEIPGMATSRLRPKVIFATNWSVGGVQRSTDYGETWPTVDVTMQAWGIDIAKDDPNVVLFAQYSLPFEAPLSIDGGTSFTHILPPSGFNNNYGIYLRDRATIFAEQSSGIWKLQNNYSYTPAVVGQTVQIAAPLDGDAWAAGSVQNITWLSTGIVIARIEYKPTSAAAWQLVADVSGYLHSYAWRVPRDITTDARIRISDYWDGAPADSLESGFTILAPRAQISPAALDFGVQGSGSSAVLPLTIKNTGTAPLTVSSIVTATGAYAAGRTSLTLAASQQDTVGIWFLPATAGTFPDTVVIASNDSAQALVRVPLTGQAVGPTIALSAPNGGESWAGGSTQSITWSSSFVATVDLAYRVAPQAPWVPIAAGLPALPAAYAWNVPFVPAAEAIVRVSGPGGTPADTSDATFTLLAGRFGAIPDTLRLPAVQVGYVGGDPLFIANTGNAPLTVSGIAVANPAFWVGRTTLTLAGGESDTIGVFYAPAAAGDDTTTLALTTDIPGGPHAVVAVSRGVVSLAAEPGIATAFTLGQNRPNPFSNSTLIQYALPRDADVTLDVFDLRGERVARLADGRETAGRHEVRFGLGAHDVRGAALGRVPAGVYFYRLQAGAQSATRKMLFVQ